MHYYGRKFLDPLLARIRRPLHQAFGRSLADKGIGRTSAAVLALAVACTGLASYTYLRHALVHDRTGILEAELERRSQQVASELRGRKQVARALTGVMDTARAMDIYQSAAADAIERTGALMTLQIAAGRLIAAGDVRALELLTSGGDRIVMAGFIPLLPELNVSLSGGSDTLYWDDGFVLRTSVVMVGENGNTGQMLADLRVRDADAAIVQNEGLGETGYAALCGLDGSRRICFPSRFQPLGTVSEVALPGEMSPDHAMSGESGTLRLVDYRSRRAYSAFKPLDGHSLAFVVQIDEAELLAPVTRQLVLGIPVLVLLAAGGIFLIGRQLRPLIAELVGAKSRADMEVVARTAAEAEVNMAKRQLQLVADNAPFLISFLDSNFIFRFANRAHVAWFERPLDQIIGKPMAAVVGEVMSAKYRLAMATAVATNLPQIFLRERNRQEGSTFVEMTFVAQLDDAGRPEGYCITVRDATENVLREQTLLVAARRDPLTGLCNRTSFNERLEQALHPVISNTGLLLTVAYLDIDHFKQVNDTFGHAVGDQLLTELGERVKDALQPSDMVARLGGDEIALIMLLRTIDDVAAVGSRLLETIRAPFETQGNRIHASASIGFAIAVPGDTVATLLKRADVALYEAKSRGRNQMFHAESALRSLAAPAQPACA
jgi:diguanylate cyclase (GGDEF)-like protein/PAS domain S-box-containing protein